MRRPAARTQSSQAAICRRRSMSFYIRCARYVTLLRLSFARKLQRYVQTQTAAGMLETLKPVTRPLHAPAPPFGLPQASKLSPAAPEVNIEVGAFHLIDNAEFSLTGLSEHTARFAGTELDFAAQRQVRALLRGTRATPMVLRQPTSISLSRVSSAITQRFHDLACRGRAGVNNENR